MFLFLPNELVFVAPIIAAVSLYRSRERTYAIAQSPTDYLPCSNHASYRGQEDSTPQSLQVSRAFQCNGCSKQTIKQKNKSEMKLNHINFNS